MLRKIKKLICKMKGHNNEVVLNETTFAGDSSKIEICKRCKGATVTVTSNGTGYKPLKKFDK